MLPDFKSMSFGQIALWGIISFVVFFVVLIIAAKLFMAPTVPQRTVTQRSEVSFQPAQQKPAISEEDVQALLDGINALAEQANSTNTSIGNIGIAIGEIKGIQDHSDANIGALYQRLMVLEDRFDKLERSGVSKKKTRTEQIVENKEDPALQAISKESGYKTMATVNNRGWVAAGEVEDSVAPGDNLPSPKSRTIKVDAPTKPFDLSTLKVEGVDAGSGIIVTTP